MSMYGQYIKELSGKEIVETDKGFATYYFINNSCYLEDIYVVPEHRREGICYQLADKVSEIAIQRGCDRLIGTVIPTANGSTNSLKVLLEYGFKLDSAANNFIAFTKDLVKES